MLRRTFLVIGSWLAMLGGCQHRQDERCPPTEVGFGDEPTHINPVDRIARAMQRCQAKSIGYTFDPITLSILAEILGGLIRYCIEQRMLKVQRICAAKPDSAIARQLKSRLFLEFEDAKCGEVELFKVRRPEHVTSHVDAAMAAFVRATPDELLTLHADVVAQLPIKMDRAARSIITVNSVEKLLP